MFQTPMFVAHDHDDVGLDAWASDTDGSKATKHKINVSTRTLPVIARISY